MQSQRTGNNERIINAVIGKNLADAVSILRGEGIEIIDTVTTDGGKLLKYDTELVIKAELVGDSAVLTLSKFLLNI